MIYVTGDTHGKEDIGKLNELSYMKNITKNDYLIILGDVGCCWNNGNYDNSVKEILSSLPCTVLWVDGNHENFDILNKYPIKEWNGGKVHFIKDDIIHLMRGQVFTIENKKFFTFGGARSVDKEYRKEGYSWWKEEMPTEEEYQEGYDNLNKNDNKVDFIISHTCPGDLVPMLVKYPFKGEEAIWNYFNTINQTVQFSDWYFGHWHMDKELGKYHCYYDTIKQIV